MIRNGLYGSILLIALVVAGCGDSAPVSDTAAQSLLRVQHCLKSLGAEHASDGSEADFFVRDLDRSNTNKPALASNGNYQVAEYEQIPFATSSKPAPPPYLVWIGQPVSDSDANPLIAISEQNSFLMYVEDPDRAVAAGARRCMTEFGT